MPTAVHLSVHLHPIESPMTVELTFRHANDGTSQRPLTIYRKSNGDGVSLLICQQRYVAGSTYQLQKVHWGSVSCDMPEAMYLNVCLPPTESPMTVGLAHRHANSGTSQRQPTT